VTEFDLARRRGLLFGALIALAILLADVLAVQLIRTRPITLLTLALNAFVVLSAVALALLAYWLWGLGRSGYALDRNQLVIRWGSQRHVVPLSAVEDVVDGLTVTGRPRLPVPRWPGYLAGAGSLPRYGLTLFFASRPLIHQVLVVTPGLTYALSPADKIGFMAAFAIRQRMGATQAAQQSSFGPSWLQWPLWRDRAAYALLGLAVALNLALFGYLTAVHAGLPRELPLHFDVAGQVDRWGTPEEFFVLPFIGLIAWLVNGAGGALLHLRRNETAAAYLLWGSAGLVQLLLWIATISLLGALYAARPL
jgi:hypothetical protein